MYKTGTRKIDSKSSKQTNHPCVTTNSLILILSPSIWLSIRNVVWDYAHTVDIYEKWLKMQFGSKQKSENRIMCSNVFSCFFSPQPPSVVVVIVNIVVFLLLLLALRSLFIHAHSLYAFIIGMRFHCLLRLLSVWLYCCKISTGYTQKKMEWDIRKWGFKQTERTSKITKLFQQSKPQPHPSRPHKLPLQNEIIK